MNNTYSIRHSVSCLLLLFIACGCLLLLLLLLLVVGLLLLMKFMLSASNRNLFIMVPERPNKGCEMRLG